MTQYLSKADFFECLYLLERAQRTEAEAKLAIAKAVERYHAKLRATGLSVEVPYRWHEATCSVDADDPVE